MQKIAAFFKVFFFLLATVLIYSAYVVPYLFIRLLNGHFEPWRNSILRFWGKCSAFILGLKVTVEGTPPKPPFFVVSNHLSYLDIPIYSSIIDTTFVSKEEVKHWPGIGVMARTLGILFINRRLRSDVTRVNREISEQLNERQGVVLFPEGMTSPGEKILRFRPSLLEHAASENLQVSYAAIRYETTPDDVPAHKSVCWWGNTPLHTHLFGVAMTKRVDVLVRFGTTTVQSDDRKELAQKLQENVERIFIPVVEELEESFEPVKF
ncbi:MAG: 1-acyl-sn-glycerol-3-phosphate acyltransferase [Balneolaceae bacterium]|nr:1-acyl-sn-glycerol-3-phosphate acyltransferase [Balneolaceae bacterium]